MDDAVQTAAATRRIDRLVGAGAVALALACGLGVLGAMRAVAPPPPPPGGTVSLELAGHRLVVPAAALRGPLPRPGLSPERLDLLLPVASLEAPVPVMLVPADGAPHPAERPALLHARFLTAEAQPVDGGLIRREFRAGTPYEGEILVLAPPDGRAFAARCPGSPGAPEGCLAEVRFGAVDARIRLRPADLPRWGAVLEAVRALVEGAGPPD